MRHLSRIAALAAGISLSAHAGTPTENAAVAEALAQLDSAKVLVTQGYTPNHKFPVTANSPLPRQLSSTKYVRFIAYNMGSSSTAAIVIGLTGTGNSMLDNSFIGMFATGQQDGTVVWICGTSAAATSTSPSAQTQLYPYLPAPCQR